MASLFKRNLVIGYGISLVLLVASAVASYISIQNLLRNQRQITHTNTVINKLETVISLLKDAETGQRGFLLTGDPVFLQPYVGASQKAFAALDAVQQLTLDNTDQQTAVEELRVVTQRRMAFLENLIRNKQQGRNATVESLKVGKSLMDEARRIATVIQRREENLLGRRNQSLNRFINATPVFIVVVSVLSIGVTLVSLFRVIRDFEKRDALQTALKERNTEIARRIEIIEGMTGKIAAGDYAVRVAGDEKENLGALAGPLNKMAAELETAFKTVEEKDWLQTGIALLNDEVIVEKDLPTLMRNIIRLVAEYSNSQTGAFYLCGNGGTLELKSQYGLSDVNKQRLQYGEGLAGESAAALKMLELDGIVPEAYAVSLAVGNLRPKAVIAFPVLFDKRSVGVIELAAMQAYSANAKAYFRFAAHNIGIAVNTAQNRQRVQELLEETQAQQEELQAQHSELENVNAELEVQAEKLQASEEELRVQQEELRQSNQELEERSQLLEEKNELILERNLDIQRKAEELQLSTRYKSEFLANMSHELRTPLNAILLLARLLSENHGHNLTLEQIEYASVIQNSGKGLLTLIDEILDLSKIESGKMELEYADVNVEAIVSNLTSIFAPLAKDKEIGFAIQVAAGVPAVIETDQLRVEQILRNLISNALKFTKHGSVQVAVTETGGALSVAVTDTGIGIPKEKQQTIFEAFQQADGSTRRQFGGTGLGLSISRELAKLLGGEISVRSQEGEGSTFTLLLPLQKTDAIATPQRIVPAQASAPQTAPGQTYLADSIPAPVPDDRDAVTSGDKLILIVEDDTAFARALLDYTRQQGYKGIVAVRGDEALDLAKTFLPAGILLDVQLPVRSGWDVMDSLKADPATRPIPVHMMSVHEVKNKSLSKGAVAFINKPVAFEKLSGVFEKIEQALGSHLKKVLIIEENSKHAKALAYFLEGYNVTTEIQSSVSQGISALNRDEAACVILDMGLPEHQSYNMLDAVKKTPGLEELPIIVFTGKNLSHVEEMKIRQYADTIVVKTAHSYQRILDEVSLFLHLVEERKSDGRPSKYKRLGEPAEVLKGKTVLVADDDVRNIFSLTKSLESYGINVISAIDGRDAVTQLDAAGNVDLVLIDMMMPEMDGYEATRRIREKAKYKSLPVIAVTAKAMTGDREKCMAAGASDYITKPVDLDQLISLLRVWLYE